MSVRNSTPPAGIHPRHVFASTGGEFSTTVTGLTTTPAIHFKYTLLADGDTVILAWTGVTGTSANPGVALGLAAALPSDIRPGTAQYRTTETVNNGTHYNGSVSIPTSGALQFFRYDSSVFNTSVPVTVYPSSVVYNLKY